MGIGINAEHYAFFEAIRYPAPIDVEAPLPDDLIEALTLLDART